MHVSYVLIWFFHSGVPFFVIICLEMVLVLWGPILCCHMFQYGSCTLGSHFVLAYVLIRCFHMFWYWHILDEYILFNICIIWFIKYARTLIKMSILFLYSNQHADSLQGHIVCYNWCPIQCPISASTKFMAYI